MSDSDLVLKTAHKPVQQIRVTKSFSYKLDMKRYDPWYENRDFFCSASGETAIENAAEVAEDLYEFCFQEVMKDVATYLAEFRKRKNGK